MSRARGGGWAQRAVQPQDVPQSRFGAELPEQLAVHASVAQVTSSESQALQAATSPEPLPAI